VASIFSVSFLHATDSSSKMTWDFMLT
jgi:hypothetical protein